MALGPQASKQTITLAMIVKNEASVITRAFDSVKHFVDYIYICDTGSTDGTPDVISKYLADHQIKGRVESKPWVNFGHNRTELFQLAAGTSDYIMTLDADEVFAPYKGDTPLLTSVVTELPLLETDCVSVKTCLGSYEYSRDQFFKDGLDWRWEQPVHEYCWCPSAKSKSVLKDVCVVPSSDGARSQNLHKFYRDALIFEDHLLEHPKDDRAWFYLAQSYRDCGKLERSLEALNKRLEMGGWDEEIFECLLRKARIKASLEGGEKSVHYYLDAYSYRPTRAEPLYDLMVLYNSCKKPRLASMFGEIAITIPFPKGDQLFVCREVYEWRIKDELSVAYHWLGKHSEAIKLIDEIFTSSGAKLDKPNTDRIKRNRKFSKDKLDGK